MNTFLTKIKQLFNKIKGFFPTALPVGVTEFNNWADSIMSTYTLPTKDRDAVLFVLGSIIMHLGPQTDRKSVHYFVRTMRAAGAKQVAANAFQEVKQRQDAARKAADEAAKQSAGATANHLMVVPNEQLRDS